MTHNIGFETVEVYKSGRLVFTGIRGEVAEYLGISRPYLSLVMSKKVKPQRFCDISFRVIPIQYEVLDGDEVIFTGSRYQIMDEFYIGESQFSKVLMGVTRLNRLYRIRRKTLRKGGDKNDNKQQHTK